MNGLYQISLQLFVCKTKLTCGSSFVIYLCLCPIRVRSRLWAEPRTAMVRVRSRLWAEPRVRRDCGRSLELPHFEFARDYGRSLGQPRLEFTHSRLGTEPRSIDCPANNIVAFKRCQLRTEVHVVS